MGAARPGGGAPLGRGGLSPGPLVARVVVDVPLAHLDRPFDYGVPEKFAELVQAGCRVRVRFSGQLVDGFVLETGESTEFTGKLLPLAHVPSGEPVLTPQVARLLRTIADRYAGTMSDVLRLAVPPRRANAEKRPSPTPDALPGPQDGERVLRQDGARGRFQAVEVPVVGDDDERAPAATTFLATQRMAYAPERSTFDGSLPEKAPPPWRAMPP